AASPGRSGLRWAAGARATLPDPHGARRETLSFRPLADDLSVPRTQPTAALTGRAFSTIKRFSGFAGTVGNGASRTRTGDLLGAIQALSQLSYSPVRARASVAALRPDQFSRRTPNRARSMVCRRDGIAR